ncbi:MAG TPA: methyltransferase domain-containing protein [Puia sp.]|nr:methyltransferase domain-containing protein [Puia sp.]
MSFSTIDFKRPLTSYAKVRIIIGNLIRGKSSFIKNNRIKDKVLLNVGCGPYPLKEFANLDYAWTPEIDVCWDFIKKKFPFPDNSFEGIFTEHCLEHISYEQCFETLKEFHRMLKPGGTIRIIVPDGQIYIDLYHERTKDPSISLPYGQEEETGIISINRIFRNHGHLFIYDAETMGLQLSKVGFRNVKKESFAAGRDKRLLIDRPERAVESLYIEATK